MQVCFKYLYESFKSNVCEELIMNICNICWVDKFTNELKLYSKENIGFEQANSFKDCVTSIIKRWVDLLKKYK